MSSTLKSKPSWLNFAPVDSNQKTCGFDNNGMWIKGNSYDVAYPIRSAMEFNTNDLVEVTFTVLHNYCTDHSVCFFNSDKEPMWSWGSDNTRISFQIDCGSPEISGLTQYSSDGSLVEGNYYTFRLTYKANSSKVQCIVYDGKSTNDSVLANFSLNEVLPEGKFKIGFDADNDEETKSYFTYLKIAKNGIDVSVENTIFPAYTFEVVSYTPQTLLDLQPYPDSLEHLILNLQQREVYIKDKVYRHGDQFTVYGMEAIRFKQLFVDSENPILKIADNTKTNYGSLYFDGSSNIVLDGSNDWAVGTGDFTVEWFQYQESSGEPYSRVFAVQPYPATQIGASVEQDGDDFYAWIGGEGFGTNISDYLEKWSHMAITRESGTLRQFKDGVVLISNSVSNDITDNSNQLYIGSTSSGNYFKGYITNFNFVKGTALYTGNFTPPTSPISADANTKLLLLASSETEMLTDSSGLGKTITNNGVSWSDLNPFA